jgi:tryptophan synthase alpha chain
VERIKTIASLAEGFVYYVSREGVTGAQAEVASGIAEQVALIKSATNVPVCVGFGISSPEQAGAVAAMSDGVVVGSAIVKLVQKHGADADLPDRVEAFVKPLVQAVKAV